jgi:hypothetical protein
MVVRAPSMRIPDTGQDNLGVVGTFYPWLWLAVAADVDKAKQGEMPIGWRNWPAFWGQHGGGNLQGDRIDTQDGIDIREADRGNSMRFT